MIERRDVFHAIADPTRRQIIQKLTHKSMNVAQIADDFEMSRQGIAKHIKVLHECGLVSLTHKGRDLFCEARVERLDQVADWVQTSRKHWNQRLHKLDEFLHEAKKHDENR